MIEKTRARKSTKPGAKKKGLKKSGLKKSGLKKSGLKKLALKKSALNLAIGKEIWPSEHDVLFRPDRLKYVRKLIRTEGCVFCTAANSGPSLETLCFFKSKHSMAVLNKYPYNSGHVLVLPQGHCGDILSLSSEQFHDLNDLVREVVKALQSLYEPGGLNLGLNLGAVAGAGIPGHLHYHVIPRWTGDLNFLPLIAESKVVVENLEVSFDRLLRYFKARK